MEDKMLVGIDFGTCNIKVSKWNNKKGTAIPVKLEKNQNLADAITPNVILYKEKEPVIGFTAQNTNEHEENQVVYIKRKLETENWVQYIPNLGKEVGAITVAKDIFTKVKAIVCEQNGGDMPDEVVITTPVCYSEMQKARILKAATEAGFNVSEVITEPLAAIFSIEDYFEDEEVEENIIVFDFGGGTLDLSLFSIENDGENNMTLKVLASNGLKYGGVDITEAIYNQIIVPNCKHILESLSEEDAKDSKAEIFKLVEDLKQELFIDDEDEVETFKILRDGSKVELSLSRQQVYDILEQHELKSRIYDLMDQLIEDARLDKEDITKVKLVGGTSRIDYFQELLYSYFDENDDILDLDDLDSDETYRAVADGSVRYLSFITEEESTLSFQNKIAFSVGTEYQGKFDPCITKNAKYGYISPKRPLDLSAYKERKAAFKVYQLFNKKRNIAITDEEVIYIGCFEIDKSKYQASTISYEMQISKQGEILGRFYDMDENSTPILIQEEKIKIEV